MLLPSLVLAAAFRLGAGGAASHSHTASAAAFRSTWLPGRGEAVAGAAAVPGQPPLPRHCGLAVVGAGWGGAYLAWRLAVDTRSVAADEVCVIEANGRVGGRVYSVHGLPHFGDVALDVGGYRFIDGDKLPAQLVRDALKLPTVCYDWNCSANCVGDVCHVVRDAYGNNAGYATPIEVMLAQVEDAGAGTQVYFGRTLRGVYPAPEAGARATRLAFADGSSVSASRLLLNLPRNAVERLDRKSVLFTDAAPDVARLLDAVTVSSITKVYVYYDDAWWNSKLGLMEGDFSEDASVVPFLGRYHDGPQRCVTGADTAGQPVYSGSKVQFGNCSGALEIYYGSTVQYYLKAMSSPLQPLTVITAADANEAQGRLLDEIHETLVTYHSQALRAQGFDPRSLVSPAVVVIANWISDGEFTPGIGELVPPLDLARAQVRMPTPDFDLFIANQDYGYKTGWAAGSLIMAEKILQADLGLPKPTWLDAEWYQENVFRKREGTIAKSNAFNAQVEFASTSLHISTARKAVA